MKQRALILAFFSTLWLAAQEAPEKPGSITGKVLNANTGEPIRRANLTLQAVGLVQTGIPSGPPPSFAATSKDDGAFRFEGLPPGEYRLTGQRTGFVPQAFGARPNSRVGAAIRLAVGQDLSGIDLRLLPQAVITGRILDEEDEPLVRAQVQLLVRRYINGRWQLAPMNMVQSQDTGEYRMGELLPGRYYISATHRVGAVFGGLAPARRNAQGEEEDYVSTYYPGVIDLAEAVPLEIGADAELRGIDIRIRKARVVRVRGQVRAESGTQYRLMMMPKDMGSGVLVPGIGGLTGPDGKFEFSGLRPGKYWVTMMGAGGPASVLGRTEVEVGDQDLEGVVVERSQNATLTGRVRTEGASQQREQAQPGKPALANIRIQLIPLDGISFSFGRVVTLEDGSFTMTDITPDRYRVFASPAPKGTYFKAVLLSGQDVTGDGISLAPGTSTQIELVFATGPGSLSGAVGDDAGRPVVGAQVTLTPVPFREGRPDLTRMSMTDQRGQFHFPDVTPGEYRVHAWEDLTIGAQYDQEFMKRHDRHGEQLTIRQGDHKELTLKAIPAVEGTFP